MSGYGIPLDGKDDLPVGLLMVDRPIEASREWLKRVGKTSGDYQLLPMTVNGDRGIVCQMKIKNESLEYVMEFPSVGSEVSHGQIRYRQGLLGT